VLAIKKDNLFLLPKRYGLAKSEDEFESKAIKKWADDMSIGDVGKLPHDLHGKLGRFNRLGCPPLERFQILGLLQTPLHFILDSLLQDCSEGNMPLSVKGRLAADMRLELMVQAVIGYKILLSQFHDDSNTSDAINPSSSKTPESTSIITSPLSNTTESTSA